MDLRHTNGRENLEKTKKYDRSVREERKTTRLMEYEGMLSVQQASGTSMASPTHTHQDGTTILTSTSVVPTPQTITCPRLKTTPQQAIILMRMAHQIPTHFKEKTEAQWYLESWSYNVSPPDSEARRRPPQMHS